MTDWDPTSYRALMREEIPEYERLQDEVVAATRAVAAREILELGTGTGETARRLLDAHPDARLHGIDASAEMLAAAREALAARSARLEVGRLEDAPLPGSFDLIVSALAVHHLDGPGKAALFRRLAPVLRPGGRLVVGDVVVPEDPAEAVIPLEPGYDLPSTVPEHLEWLRAAALTPVVAWRRADLAVIVGCAPDPSSGELPPAAGEAMIAARRTAEHTTGGDAG